MKGIYYIYRSGPSVRWSVGMSVFWSFCRLSQFLSVQEYKGKEKSRKVPMSVCQLFFVVHYTVFFLSVCLSVRHFVKNCKYNVD